jgi:hypothetical protein
MTIQVERYISDVWKVLYARPSGLQIQGELPS